MTDTIRYRATALQAVLDEQGRKAAWVAERSGLTRFQMSHIVNGRRTVVEPVGQKIAEVLGVPFFVLFELSDDAETAPSGSTRE